MHTINLRITNEIQLLSRSSLFYTLIMLAVAMGCTSAGEGKQESNEQSLSVQNITTTRIPIEGMSCMSCVATVKKALSSIEGVNEVSVNLQEKNTVVKFDEGLTSAEQLKTAINKAGYKAGNAQIMEQ